MKRYVIFLLGIIYCQFTWSATLLVANKSSNTITLFNEATQKAIKELPVGHSPHEVAVTPNGKWALVSNYGSDKQPGSSLTLLDIAAGKVINTINIPMGSRPHGIQFLSDRRALVTAEGIQSLLLIDINQGTVLKRLPLPGNGAHLLRIDSEKRFVYLTNIYSGTLTKIDLRNFTVAGELIIGKAAEGIALMADEQWLLVSNRKEHIIAVVRAKDLALLKKIKTDFGPIRIALFNNGRTAIFTNCISGTAQTLDLTTFTLLQKFKTTHKYSCKKGKFGGFILPVPITVVVKNNQSAYIANSFAGNITLVDLQTGEILKTFEANKEPDGMAVSPLDVS